MILRCGPTPGWCRRELRTALVGFIPPKPAVVVFNITPQPTVVRLRNTRKDRGIWLMIRTIFKARRVVIKKLEREKEPINCCRKRCLYCKAKAQTDDVRGSPPAAENNTKNNSGDNEEQEDEKTETNDSLLAGSSSRCDSLVCVLDSEGRRQ